MGGYLSSATPAEVKEDPTLPETLKRIDDQISMIELNIKRTEKKCEDLTLEAKDSLK